MNTPNPKPGPIHEWASVELTPELPLAVFTSTERWHPERIGALALYCSDGRWGEAFDDFCHKHLQIPRYDRLAVPGGPALLALGDDKNGVFQATRQHFDFLVKVHELERIVLITHFGCAHYTHRLQKSAHDILPAQAQDIRTAALLLRNWYPQIQVESYLAMRRENCLSFHRLGS